MVIVVGPSNFYVCDVWIDFLHMVFCRSTFKQRVARPRRYGFCIFLFLRCRSSQSPSAQRRPRRVAVTINAGHELSELTRLRRPKIDRCDFLMSCRSPPAPWGREGEFAGHSNRSVPSRPRCGHTGAQNGRPIPAFADCRCRIDTFDNGGFTGMLRVQIVSFGATKIRRESPESRTPRCRLAAAMGPSARQGIRL
jgi:hypothetical protein